VRSTKKVTSNAVEQIKYEKKDPVLIFYCSANMRLHAFQTLKITTKGELKIRTEENLTERV